MYLVGFAAAWWLGRVRAARPGSTWKALDVDDFIFFAMLGVILGGRVGYVLFYGLGYWAEDALYPLKIWEGGMSFHGGLARRDGRDRGVRRAPRAQRVRRVRLRRGGAGHRPARRTARQLHQRRAVGQAHRRALGLPGRRAGAPCHPALRGGARGRGAVRGVVVVHVPAASAPGAVGPVPRALRRLAHAGRILAGARCPHRLPVRWLADHGAPLDPADAARGHRVAGGRLPARRTLRQPGTVGAAPAPAAGLGLGRR